MLCHATRGTAHCCITLNDSISLNFRELGALDSHASLLLVTQLEHATHDSKLCVNHGSKLSAVLKTCYAFAWLESVQHSETLVRAGQETLEWLVNVGKDTG